MLEEKLAQEVVIYQDDQGVMVTDKRVVTPEGSWDLVALSRVEDQAANHVLPEICQALAGVLLVLAPFLLLWSVFGQGPGVWAVVASLGLGFLLLWAGTETEGYQRWLVLSGKGRSWRICQLDRPWAKGWYGGEAREKRYWALKEAIEKALANGQGTHSPVRSSPISAQAPKKEDLQGSDAPGGHPPDGARPPRRHAEGQRATTPRAGPAAPPSLYRAGPWRLALAVVRIVPTWALRGLATAAAELHFRCWRTRRQVVAQNLLPACGGNERLATQTARRLYRRFALKLVDLWRVESGQSVLDWITGPGDLERIEAALARGRGIAFVTLHLGNWEHGGLLLAQVGIPLTVLTLAEPGDGLTELRSASRVRWGIQTLVIGQDGFAFVEVIQRLRAGAAVALSIDRPLPHATVLVELFGRPFPASLAAAELARASGCALLGVTVVREPGGFAIKVLPEFTYDRQALGRREARQALTEQIVRAFEPEIREHLDQWYQFVPVWPTPTQERV